MIVHVKRVFHFELIFFSSRSSTLQCLTVKGEAVKLHIWTNFTTHFTLSCSIFISVWPKKTRRFDGLRQISPTHPCYYCPNIIKHRRVLQLLLENFVVLIVVNIFTKWEKHILYNTETFWSNNARTNFLINFRGAAN